MCDFISGVTWFELRRQNNNQPRRGEMGAAAALPGQFELRADAPKQQSDAVGGEGGGGHIARGRLRQPVPADAPKQQCQCRLLVVTCRHCRRHARRHLLPLSLSRSSPLAAHHHARHRAPMSRSSSPVALVVIRLVALGVDRLSSRLLVLALVVTLVLERVTALFVGNGRRSSIARSSTRRRACRCESHCALRAKGVDRERIKFAKVAGVCRQCVEGSDAAAGRFCGDKRREQWVTSSMKAA
jgi:hypothetical protein